MFVIDTGPDFRQQMLRAQVDRVDAVLFTHEHKDHIAGLDDIRPYNFKHKKAMEIYATEAVQEALHREYHYVFSDFKYPGVPEVKLHTIASGESFWVQGIDIQPVEVMHYKMPVLGFRVGNLAYLTDAKTIAPEEMEKLMGLDVLVVNALRRQEHISHLNLDQALELVEALNPGRAFFTHISHLMGPHADVSRLLPEGVEIAYDGLQVSC